jgi:hypothetical protein
MSIGVHDCWIKESSMHDGFTALPHEIVPQMSRPGFVD